MWQLSSAYIEEGISEAHETNRAPLSFSAQLYVEHSPAAVWSCFSNLARWGEWSPICRGCRLSHPGELRLGSVLEIRFKVAGLILTVLARVVQFDPPESMTWRGEKFGIRASHTYSFKPHNQGTILCNHETLSGARFPLDRLIRAWYRIGKVSSESLKCLERELRRAKLGTAR
jgi:uncharacterized protein YndB with AHSA1/START domain